MTRPAPRASRPWPVRPLRRPGALLKLGYSCNCACRFCHSAPHRGTDLDTAQARQRIALAADAGVERIVFSGGEPTLRKDLVGLVSEVAARGLTPGLVTNGRMLAYQGLREALAEAGLGQVYLSLHSHRAAVHDDLVRAEAHRHTLAALRWLVAEPDIDLRVNCVVTRPNLPDLAGLVRLVSRVADGAAVTLTLSAVEPEGNALEAFDDLVPTAREAAAAVGRVLRRLAAPAREAGVALRVDGFPPCLLPEARDVTSDLWTEGFVFLTEAFEPELHPIDDQAKARGGPCRRCSLDGCPGLYRTYLARRGDAELRPIVEPRGSAVDFVDQGPVDRFDPRRCPIRAGRWPHPDPRRELLLREGDAVRLHRCGAPDFTEQELRRLHPRWRQVYRPTDPGQQAVDFGTSLVKLRPAAACERCPHRRACGALWVRDRRNVIAVDERRVEALLGRLRGRVLDVGCGAARYARALAPAVGRGRVRLHLLDPDPASRDAVRRANVEHVFHPVGIEDLDLSPVEPFDHVLAIRSWSHVRDVDQAARVIARVLAPRGQAWIIGDTVIGLARSRKAARQGRQRADLPEHLRNHGPEEAWGVFSALHGQPFELIELIQPEPEGSNLWWVHLRRR